MFHTARPMNGLLVRVFLLAIIGGGIAEIVGGTGFAGISGGIGAVVIQEWRRYQELGSWDEQRRVATAVRENRDPGPRFRAEVERHADYLVAHHRWVIWGGTAFLGGIAAVFLATAVVAHRTPLTWLGIALLVALPGLALVQWRAVALAALWLANAPEPSEATPG
jgi:hypothetical protein